MNLDTCLLTCKRVIKYVLEGLMVAFAALVLPKKSMSVEDVLALALVAAATFAVLDMYAPNTAATARQGAGFGIGTTWLDSQILIV